MNNNQRFDDNIKEQFEYYTPLVQPHIWENIVAERKKRKPVGFWFTFFNGRTIIGLSLLLLAAGGGAFILFSKQNTTKQNQPVASAAPDQPVIPATVNTNTGAGTEKNAGNSNPSNTNSILNQQNVIDGNTANANNTNKKENSTTNYSTFNKAGSLKIKIHAPSAQEDDENAVLVKSKKNNLPNANDYEISGTDLLTVKPAENNYLKRILFPGLQQVTTVTKTATLKNRIPPNVNLPGCPRIEKNAAGNKTYIEIYGGPDVAFRNLTDTGSNSAYLKSRKESTKFSSAFSAGIRYTKVFNNGVSIRSGLNYSQINEKFTLVQGNIVQVTYIINANGDTTGSYVTTGTRYKTTYNKYKTVDVPILIGYEMGNGKLHANINAGVIVNIYSWQKGDVLDMNGNPVSITTGKGSTAYGFKTNIGMGFMTSASFYYKLNDKLHVLAEPYYRYSLAPMTNEALTLKQKYNTAGLRVGIRLDLQ